MMVEVELVKQFSSQVPIRVISNMMGLPREDEDTFVGWYQALIAGLGFGGEHMLRGVQARNEMWDYIDPLIKERSVNPGEDLLSRICTAELDGSRMTVEEIKGFVALLLAAGGDTTDKAIANMWYHLLYTRPDQLQDVQQDPGLWENVFTENDALRCGRACAVPFHHPGGSDPRRGYSRACRCHPVPRCR